MFFLGLWWELHLKTGFPCLFGLFWEIMPISSIWKRDFPFLGLWWEPLENNINIFYLKTGFPLFFFGLWWQPLENNITLWVQDPYFWGPRNCLGSGPYKVHPWQWLKHVPFEVPDLKRNDLWDIAFGNWNWGCASCIELAAFFLSLFQHCCQSRIQDHASPTQGPRPN